MVRNTTTATTEATDETVVANLTPYGASKIANAAFNAAGLPSVPPQMLYNYTTAKLRKGQKPLIKFTVEAGVDTDDLQRWITSYIAKKAAAQAVVADEVAEETTV